MSVLLQVLPLGAEDARSVWKFLSSAVRQSIEETSIWQWLTLLLAIFLGVVVGKGLSRFFHWIDQRLTGKGWVIRGRAFRALSDPLSLLILAIGLSVGLGAVQMTNSARVVVFHGMLMLYAIVVAWALYSLVSVVDLWLIRMTARTKSNLDDQIVPLVRKTLKIFIVVSSVLFIASNVFDRDISAWLAGLGIVGLAVSLAAQDTIKNLFGSLMIIFDQPYQVGDQIVFDGHDGTVVDIGFRSTKMRRGDGNFVTIPNARVSDASIVNVTRRQNIQRVIDIPLPRTTSPEKVDRAIDVIRGMLAEEEFVDGFDTKGTPRVYVEGFTPTAINIRVWYWWKNPKDFWGYMDFSERINLRILRVLADEGIDRVAPVAPPVTALPVVHRDISQSGR